MIMQTPDSDDYFFSEFLTTPPAAEVHRSVLGQPPMDDWRFSPEKLKRTRMWIDLGHSSQVMKPHMSMTPNAATECLEPVSTLYFG